MNVPKNISNSLFNQDSQLLTGYKADSRAKISDILDQKFKGEYAKFNMLTQQLEKFDYIVEEELSKPKVFGQADLSQFIPSAEAFLEKIKAIKIDFKSLLEFPLSVESFLDIERYFVLRHKLETTISELGMFFTAKYYIDSGNNNFKNAFHLLEYKLLPLFETRTAMTDNMVSLFLKDVNEGEFSKVLQGVDSEAFTNYLIKRYRKKDHILQSGTEERFSQLNTASAKNENDFRVFQGQVRIISDRVKELLQGKEEYKNITYPVSLANAFKLLRGTENSEMTQAIMEALLPQLEVNKKIAGGMILQQQEYLYEKLKLQGYTSVLHRFEEETGWNPQEIETFLDSLTETKETFQKYAHFIGRVLQLNRKIYSTELYPKVTGIKFSQSEFKTIIEKVGSKIYDEEALRKIFSLLQLGGNFSSGITLNYGPIGSMSLVNAAEPFDIEDATSEVHESLGHVGNHLLARSRYYLEDHLQNAVLREVSPYGAEFLFGAETLSGNFTPGKHQQKYRLYNILKRGFWLFAHLLNTKLEHWVYQQNGKFTTNDILTQNKTIIGNYYGNAVDVQLTDIYRCFTRTPVLGDGDFINISYLIPNLFYPILKKIQEGDKESLEMYREFLSAFGTRRQLPKEILANMGIDLADPEPIHLLTQDLNQEMDKFLEDYGIGEK